MSLHQEMGNQVHMLSVIPLALMITSPSAAHKDFGHFYGSSYVAMPDGSRTPVRLANTLLESHEEVVTSAGIVSGGGWSASD